MKSKQEKNKKTILFGVGLSFAITAILLAALNFNAILNKVIELTMGKEFQKLVGEPTIGKWYSKEFENAVSSDGSKWEGYLKKGSENKVMVIFFGGGLSVDEFTAARPLNNDGGFYAADVSVGQHIMANAYVKWGIGNDKDENPFKDWSIIIIPYNNGDFHSGQGDFEYTDLDGNTKTLYHHGYTNYQMMMNEALKYIGNEAEQVLITGASAGGFGAALLADDVTTFFPNTKDFTVFVDSSLLLNKDWNKVMTGVWNSPDALSESIHTDNITLDALMNFSKNHPEGNVLFSSSIRDNSLAQMQTYFDFGEYCKNPGQVEGDQYQMNLTKMVKDLQSNILRCGIYIWDKVAQKSGHLTVHTAQGTKIFFEKRGENPTIAEWVDAAVNGDIDSYGLNLLEMEY